MLGARSSRAKQGADRDGWHGRKEAQRVQKLPVCSSSMGPARSTMVDLN